MAEDLPVYALNRPCYVASTLDGQCRVGVYTRGRVGAAATTETNSRRVASAPRLSTTETFSRSGRKHDSPAIARVHDGRAAPEHVLALLQRERQGIRRRSTRLRGSRRRHRGVHVHQGGLPLGATPRGNSKRGRRTTRGPLGERSRRAVAATRRGSSAASGRGDGRGSSAAIAAASTSDAQAHIHINPVQLVVASNDAGDELLKTYEENPFSGFALPGDWFEPEPESSASLTPSLGSTP